VLSIPLGLLEFKIVKQELLSYGYAIHVTKVETEERYPCCGYSPSTVHDRRTRKVRDLAIFHQPVYLFVKHYRCLNVPKCFLLLSNRFHQTNITPIGFASTCMNIVKAPPFKRSAERTVFRI
jgi:hypothetical protein